jgi:DNA uptake protein ComE-like DNA-binding protein
VLIIVMVVVVVISLSGFGFVASMSSENKAVRLRGEQLQMEYAIASAEEFLKQFLDRPQLPNLDIQPATEDDYAMRGVVVVDENGPHGRVRFTVLSPQTTESKTQHWRYGMEPESTRLDLRTVMEWESARPGMGRLSLLGLPGMTESIADALLDWMDTDTTPRQSGAEEDYYAGLNPPYRPRNGLPDSLEELLLVKGVTRSLMFGRDWNQNHYLDLDEQSNGSRSPQTDNSSDDDRPWIDLLTLYGGERNLSRDGQPRINLNQFDLAQLHQQISDAFDPKLATYVVNYRQFGPFQGPGSAADVGTASPNFALPPRAMFRSPLDLIQSRVQGSSGGVVRLISSPVPTQREKLDQFLSQLCDRVTVTNEPVIRGRVNVNLAPVEVLRAIPGIDKALAEQIVTSRRAASKRSQQREQHPCWLFTEGLVSLIKMKELFPFLTAGGDAHRAQIIAFSETSRLSQRVELVLDASVKPARRVFWRDLQVLGRGYPWDVLDTPGGVTFTQPGAADATLPSN